MSVSAANKRGLVILAGLLLLNPGPGPGSFAEPRPSIKDEKAVKPILPSIETDRFFIYTLEIGDGIKTQERDLRQRIVEELPRGILEARKLEYYDPSTIHDTAKFKLNLESSTLEPEALAAAVGQWKLKWMIILSLSLAPGGPNEKRMLLTGRLLDLQEAHCNITYLNLQRELGVEGLDEAVVREKQRAMEKLNCRGKSFVPNATVDLKDFDELRPSVRSLFAMLFQIPEITKSPITSLDYSTDDVAVVRHDLKSNLRRKNAKPWMQPENNDNYSVVSKLYRLTPEMVSQLCPNPRLSLRNSREFSSYRVQVQHHFTEVIPVSDKDVSFVTFASGEGAGQTHLYFPYESSYLLSTSNVALSQENEYRAMTVPADPSAMCIHFHEPRLRYGLGVRWDSLFSTGSQALSFGIDLGLSPRITGAGYFLFPSIMLGPVLGLGYQAFPADTEEGSVRHRTTAELRLRLTAELFRIPNRLAPINFRAFGDGGAGVEWMGDNSSRFDQGWQAYAAYGGGGGVRIGGFVASIFFQQLYRFIPITSIPDAAQRDALSNSVWIQLGIEGARQHPSVKQPPQRVVQ